MTEEQIREELAAALSVPSTADTRGLIKEIAGRLYEGTWRIGHDTASHTAYALGHVILSRQESIMSALDYAARRIHDDLSTAPDVDPLDDPKDKLLQWAVVTPVTGALYLLTDTTKASALEHVRATAHDSATTVCLYKLTTTVKVSVEYLEIEADQ